MIEPFFIGLVGMSAITACWSLAFVLFRVGAKGSMARKLAVLLIVEGITLFTAGYPEFLIMPLNDFITQYPALFIAQGCLHWLSDGAVLALYPPFLAAALVTSLTRPFASKRARVFLWVYGMSVAVAAIVLSGLMELIVGEIILYSSMMLLFVYGFTAAIDAWRQSKPGLARTRAGIFAIAFGIRDISWGFVYGASVWMSFTNNFSADTELFWQVKLVYALGTLIAVPLIAYGILRTHLFDIDLKLRWTIKQSTFALAVVVITFVVSEGVEMFVSAELGDKWGLVAAAIALLLLKPLQSFAERIVSFIMPNTKNTPAYKNSRKSEVYEAAFSEAMEDGGVSEKERALLNHLRDSLGLSSDEAGAIEAHSAS